MTDAATALREAREALEAVENAFDGNCGEFYHDACGCGADLLGPVRSALSALDGLSVVEGYVDVVDTVDGRFCCCFDTDQRFQGADSQPALLLLSPTPEANDG